MFVPFHAGRRHQPVRGLRATSRSSTGSATAPSTGNIQRLDRILRGRGRRSRPLQAGQAGRHGHALLPVLRRRSSRALFDAARLRLRPGADPAHDRLLRPAHLARLDAEPRHPRRRARRPGSRAARGSGSCVALESDIGDVQGGTTKEGIHMGVMSGTLDLRAARLRRQRRPRRRAVLRSDADSTGSTGSSFSMQFRGTPMRVTIAGDELTVAALRRGLPPARQGRRRRRGPRAGAPATAARSRSARGAGARRDGERCRTGFRGAIFDVDGVLVDSPHERAWRETLRELMEDELERHPRRDDASRPSGSPRRSTSRSMSGKPRHERRPRGARPLRGARRRAARRGLRRAQADRWCRADRGGGVHGLPRRAALRARASGGGDPRSPRRRRRRTPGCSSADPARHVRREQGLGDDFVRPGMTLLDLFDADISGRDFAHGKPAPRDLPDRRRRARRPAGRVLRGRGRRRGHPGRQGAAAWPRSGVARADDAALLAGAGADLVVTSLDDVDVDRLGEGRLVTKAA